MNFIEKHTKKVALILCLATAGTAVTTVYAATNADGWHGTGADRIYKEEGAVKTSSWLFDESGSFYLDADGHPIIGEWKTINGSVYYFDSEGHRVNGKQVIDGHEYQFQKSGVLLTGWNQTKTSYYSEFGEKLNGLQTIDEKQYLFDKDGNIVSGWQTVDGKKLYFKKDGSLATAKTEIDGKTYNFSSDGSLQSGWVKKDGEKYYYDKYGFMTKGWKTIDGKKYYFNRKGQAATSTKYAGYKFDKNGVAKKIKEKKKEETTESNENVQSTRTAGNSSAAASSSSSSSSANLNPAGSGSNSSAAGIAASMVGSPYVWGGSSPAGFDCSGLTSYAYAQAGISIPRTAGGQASVCSAVSYGNMQPGDLIVWSGGAHVSIYVGGGQMVHATNPSTGVITSSVSFWSNNSGQSITAIRRP